MPSQGIHQGSLRPQVGTSGEDRALTPDPDKVIYVKAPSEYTVFGTQDRFLFVDESASGPGKKQGGRKELRSHVRKHVLAQERLKPKTFFRQATKAASEAALTFPPLKAQKDQGGNVAIVCAPSESPQLQGVERHSDDWRIARPQDASLPFQPSKSSLHTNDHIAIEDSNLSYCIRCGKYRNPSLEDPHLSSNALVLSSVNQKQKSQFSLHPSQLLGAGRVDPFGSYPVEEPKMHLNMHELIDHSVTYLLPGLISDGSNNEKSSLAHHWFSTGLRHPLLFHALAFAGSIHLDFVRWGTIHPNSAVSISHKLAVIQQLNKVLKHPEAAASRDEVILAILILASHETVDMSESKNSPFDSPLRSAQWLNVYGNFKNVPEHLAAVIELLRLRGGVENLKLYGLAEILTGGDVVTATNSSSKPFFEPLCQSAKWITLVSSWAISALHEPFLARGFPEYCSFGITPEMLFVLQAMAATTTAIDHYLKGYPGGLSLSVISRTRTSVQQRLMSLPSFAETELLNPKNKIDIYEPCRITAMIYAIGVTFPIPNSGPPLQHLVTKLKLAIKTAEIWTFFETVSEVFLWMLIIGGIAALNYIERIWYIKQLVLFSKRCAVHDWNCIKSILGKFLWLDSACDAGGRQLWLEVMEAYDLGRTEVEMKLQKGFVESGL